MAEAKCAKKLEALKWFYHAMIEPLTASTEHPCEWCEDRGKDRKNKPTKIYWLWCNADPKGYFNRLCDDCASICAGG